MKRPRNKKMDLKLAFRVNLDSLTRIKKQDDFKSALIKKMRSPLFQSSLLYSKGKFLTAGFGGDDTEFPSTTIDNLLTIILLKLKKEVSLLEKYVVLKKEYEIKVLNGDYHSALEIVEKVGTLSGYSYWYLESKFSTLSLLKDIDGMRSFYSIIKKQKLTGIEQRDLDLIFDRTSPKSKIDRISYSLDSLKDGLTIEGAVDCYIVDFMHRFNCSIKYNATQVLSYYWQCNIIDIYNAILRLLFTNSIDHKNLNENLNEEFNLISDSINDIKLISFFGNANIYDEDFTGKYLTLCDHYITGDYKKCKDYYETHFISKPLIYSIYEFYINSLLNLELEPAMKNNGIFDELISSSVSSGCEFKDSQDSNKLFYMLNHIDVLQFVSLRSEKRIVNFKKEKTENIYRFFEFTSFPFNPFNPQNSYKDCISSKITHSNIEDNLDGIIPKYRNNKRIGDYYFNRKNFNKATEIYLGISDAPPHMIDEINNKIILCYFYNDQLTNACNFICDLFFNGDLNIDRVDAEQVLEALEECETPENIKIEIPIAVYLIASKVNEDQVVSLYLDDYLDFVGLNKPSEIEAKDDKHSFLMHKVCNINVLESLHTVRNIYSSSSDRLLDRTLILSKLDAKNSPEIINEIKFLTIQYSRNLCKKDIGQGKININFDVLTEVIKVEKASYINNMIDYFNRDKDNFTFEINEIAKQKDSQIYNSVYEFLCAVRDVYSIDSKYGLDYQLNTKIRHNGIVPAIRSIFESEGIMCKNSEGNYLDNEKFEQEGKCLLVESAYTDYQDKIKSFSKHVDLRLSKLKSVYMQIMTNDKTEKDRLFKFVIENKDIASFIMFLGDDKSEDEYVKQALELLKVKTEQCLKIGSALISTGLSDDFSSELKELRSYFKSFHGENFKSVLSLVLNDLNGKLDGISQWLSFSEVIGENFELELAIYEAESFTKTIFPDVDVIIKSKTDCDLLYYGKYLDSFVHMFILLFENASKRRKYPERIEINVDITASENKNVTVKVSNKSLLIDQESIEKINSEINSSECLHYANKENKSGIFKVKKIFELDFHCTNEISLSKEDDTFIFEATLDVSNILKGETNE